MPRIRPLRPADRDAVAALFVAAYPYRAGDLVWSDDQVRRWVAADGARVVGYGSFWPVRDRRYRMDLTVASEHRRRGTGGEPLDVLVGAARAAGAATVQARTEDDRPQVLAFFTRRGSPRPCACTGWSWTWRAPRSPRTPASSPGSPLRASP